MKKITLLSLAFILFAFVSNAQITKGSTFLGGSLGGSTGNQEISGTDQENSVGNWNLSLQFGKAVAPNRIAGIFANTFHGKSKSSIASSSSEYENHSYGGGIFYRRYFNLSSKWYLFGDGNLGFSSSIAKDKLNGALSDKIKTWSLGLFITPGISFAAGPRLHIETSLNSLFGINYAHSRRNVYQPNGFISNTVTSDQLGASANLSGFSNINFGLRWIIPSKGSSGNKPS